MKLKFALTLVIALLCMAESSFAQTPAHVVGCSHCRFNKNYGKNKLPNPDPSTPRANEECGCPACREITKKEQVARKAEQKRRDDAIAAKKKAELDAKQKAMKEEQARQKEKSKSTNVVINGNNNTFIPESVQKPAPKDTSKHGYMWANGYEVYDLVTKKKILYPPDKQPEVAYGVIGPMGQANSLINGKAYFLHPPGLAVIKVWEKQTTYCNNQLKNNWDLVDYSFNRIFNSDDIHYLEHFFGDWFAVFYNPCETRQHAYTTEYKSLKFYNVKTKKFHDFPLQSAYKFTVEATKTLYHNGIGRYVFHNRHYISGKYSSTDVNSNWNNNSNSNGAITHHSYELLLDKVSGGTDGWKAGTIFTVMRSSVKGDYYFVAVVLDKNDQFVQFPVSKEDQWKYWNGDPK